MANASSNPSDTFVIVDDHKAICDMLAYYMKGALPALKHAGSFKTVKSAIEELPKIMPRVVIIDFRLGDGTGLNVVKELRSKLPNTLWLLFTGTPKTAIHDALQAGVHGCVSKGSDFKEVVKAVTALLKGESYFCAETTTALAAIVGHPDILTETEKRILSCFAKGKEPKEIAEDLNIGIKTVHNCTASIRTKLSGKVGNGSLVELARYAVEAGLAPAS